MLKRGLLLSILLYAGICRPQCPDKETLSERLIIDMRADTAYLKMQLRDLLQYEAAIKNCSYRTDSIEAALLKSIRSIYYLQQDYINAIKYDRRLITFITQNAGKPNISETDLVSAYFWLSQYYDALHNVSGKMRAVDSCISIALRLNIKSDISCVRALYERVKYFFDKGDYHRCIRDAELCERMAWAYVENAPPDYRATGESFAFSSAGWYINAHLALKNYAALEQYISEKITKYQTPGRRKDLGVAYAQLADVQVNKSNLDLAIGYYNKSLKVSQQTGAHLQCKQILNALGHDVYYKKLKDYKKALACFTAALRYRSRDEPKEDSAESLNIYSRMANVYVAKNRFDSAHIYFSKAFGQVRRGADETYLLHASPDEMKNYAKVHYMAALVMDKGDAYLAQYKQQGNANHLAHAIRVYKIADALLNKIKAEQSETSTKLFWRYDTRRLYEHAIEACELHNNMADAFYFFEKSRATLLNDQLTAQHWLGTEDIAQMMQVRKKLSQIELTLATAAADPERYNYLHLQRAGLMEQLYKLEDVVSKRNPLYYRNMIDTGSVSLHDIQDSLRKEQKTLLEIFVGDSAVYVLTVMPGKAWLNSIDKASYDALTASFTSYLADHTRLNSDYGNFRKVAHQLYALIFRNTALPKGRIIISLDGSHFPFEALVTDNRGAEPVYFVRDHAVSYTYSARYLQNSFSPGKSAGNKFLLGVAPVTYATRLNLRALAGSDASLKNVNRYYGGYYGLIGADASRDKFLGTFSDYKVVQLYTHASDNSADSSGHNEPVIYFADAPLYLSELMPQGKPSTRLIVLSACETAGGKVYQGEGVFSFNRGFAAMGIPSSITNLWAVENRSTYRLTELFYKYMAEGHPLDIALQKAKLEFLRTATGRESLPYYWSASIMMGKTDAIVYDKPQQYWKWLLAVVVIAIIGFFVLKHYRKKN